MQRRALCGAAAGAFLWFALTAGAAEPGRVVFDFESGDLQGWAVVEGGFDRLISDREHFHHHTPKVRYNKQGKYFLSTLETAKGTPNDVMTGVVESPVFVLRGGAATLLVGGGNHKDTYVALCALDGTELLRAAGANTQTMQSVTWDVSGLAGRKVFLRIVDRHTGGWGHITFDDFRAEGELDPTATAERAALREKAAREKAQRQAREVLAGGFTSLRSAVANLIATFGDRYAQGKEFLARTEALEARFNKASLDQLPRLESEFRALQREALVANPLVSAQPLLFVVRKQYRRDHHNTETMFQTGEINTKSFTGRGAIKTLDLRRTTEGGAGAVKTLLDVPEGVARDPELSFDGRTILFSMRRNIDDDYHLYEIGADGAGLRQLTFGAGVTDIDPLYLPDGRIVFTSTREPKYCMCNRHIMGNLFRMDADGANIHQIGHSTLHEGHAALTPDGRILYDRWEYVDRNFGDAQGTWIVNPDGTNHAIVYGNNTKSPGAVLDARAIPGTQRIIATFSSCHDRPWGAVAIVDPTLGVDGKPPVLRIWPPSAMNLVMNGNYDTFQVVQPKYEDPYPLSDKHFLCSRQMEGENMGIFLLDVFGNEVLLHHEAPGCFDPMPVAARPRPPVIPDRIKLDETEGTFYVHDVYLGTGMEKVRRGAVKWLRVVESPEKRFWTHTSWQGSGTQAPAMAWNDFNNKRILGTVPVEEDGSAYFRVPADTFVYFQLLDENGMMVQPMRSGTIARPGETTGCIGCHDSRLSAVPNVHKRGASRAPDRLRPWRGETRDFSYIAEVQPVFDKHCVKCHDYGKPAGKKLVLAGDLSLAFNVSYMELRHKNIVKVVGAGPAEVQPPYSWGSHASRLVEVLRKGHEGVKLDPGSLDRIITWIDINAPYYPNYASAFPDNLHGRSPLNNRQLQELSALTGLDLTKQSQSPLVNFTRPELSPCLVALADKAGPQYQRALALIREGAQVLAAAPRMDLPSPMLTGIEARRQAKYESLARTQAETRQAMIRGEKKYHDETAGR